MHSRTILTVVCIAASAAVGLSTIDRAHAADAIAVSKPITFDIKPQPLASALNAFAVQSHQQILFTPEVAAGKTSAGIKGASAPDAALAQVLIGTGLVSSRSADGMILVTTADAKEASAKSDPPLAPNGATNNQDQKPRAERRDQLIPSTGLEEIIVTAQKRSENLMNVPASITALSAASLQTQGVVNFSDYMTLVPSLSDFSGGSEGHGAMILRALNTGYYQFSNTLGYYIDDIPFSATSPLSYGTFLTMDPDLTDIDHLEVLKGPQSTLYGASTLGGLIKVVTKKPDLNSDGGEVEFDGSTIDGGASGYGLVGNANVVLIPGQLALRISGFDRDNPGYMTNVELGTKDRGVSRKEGGRITLLWAPNEDLDIKVSAFLQDLRVDGWNYEYVNLQTLAPLTGPYTYSASFDPSFHTTYEVYNATINYKLGSIGTLTNSTSYASYTDHESEDYSIYYGPLYNSIAPEPVPANAAQPLLYSPSLDKFSEELRFTSQRLGAFEWLAGLFFTNEQIGYTNKFLNVIPPSLQPIPGPDGNAGSFESPANYKEEAAFFDLTYYFSDTVDLTVGGRYSHNKQEQTYCQSGFALTNGCIPNGSSDTDFTYLAAMSWHPAPNVNTYARVATSYRPGGPQNTPLPGYPTSFKPDSLINYEVGLKADWFDRRLRTNLALYDMAWKDVQMTSSIESFPVISNGGKATVKGVELETLFVPIEHFTLGLNLAYTDAKLDSVSAGVSATTGAVAGDRLPFTPEWAASAVADYVQPLSGTLTSNFGLTYRYQGNKWSDYPGDPGNTGVVIPHYDTLDIRTGLTWSRYRLQARVANLFNSHGLDSVVDQRIAGEGNPPAWAAIIPPRTFSLSFGITF